MLLGLDSGRFTGFCCPSLKGACLTWPPTEGQCYYRATALQAWWFTSLCRPDNTFLRKVVALPGEGPAERYGGIDGVEVWDDTLVIPWLGCGPTGRH